MSHTTSIKATKITSITALQAAINDLAAKGINIGLQQNATPRAYFKGQEGMGQADYVVSLPSCCYDIGLYADGKGGFEARTDFWGGDIEKLLGAKASAPEYEGQAKMGQLFQAYAVNATLEQARREGKMVQKREDAVTGRIQLVVSGF